MLSKVSVGTKCLNLEIMPRDLLIFEEIIMCCNVKSAEITRCSVTCRAAKKYRGGTGYTISGQRYYSSDISRFWSLRPVAIVNPDCTVILL